MITPIAYREGVVELIDQTRLPWECSVRKTRDYRELAQAIRQLVVRGAPAIGIAAAYGVVLAIEELDDVAQLDQRFNEALEELRGTRPTAVNLFWSLDRMARTLEKHRKESLEKIKGALLAEAVQIQEDDVEANQRMGCYGAELVPQGATLLTHCNAGALATGGYGTALGVVRAAWEAGKLEKVLVDETRPLFQGARLTAWELEQEGIPFELIADDMAGHLMACGEVSAVLVGADRISENGDTANKIGTYSLAVLANYHRLPFYVVAPTSTIDPALHDGSEIPIEERSPLEVTHIQSLTIAPPGTRVRNPAFDVTPHGLIRAIITERGVLRPPFIQAICDVFS
jgi:methylthioribose-1-phosphate isomerase